MTRLDVRDGSALRRDELGIDKQGSGAGSFYSRAMAVAFGVWLLLLAVDGRAQYFQTRAESGKQVISRSKSFDTISLVKMVPFDLPSRNDTATLNYHEPMPDSLMPRSAIVIGEVTIIEEESDQVTAKLEKYARQVGADWIVSYSEPKRRLTKDGWRYYKGSALLLKVLDPTLVSTSELNYAYDQMDQMQTYGDVMNWFSTYGRAMGAK